MESLNDDIVLYNRFAELAMLNEKYDPWVKKRPIAQEYFMFEINNLDHVKEKVSFNFWYQDFEGVKFMGIIQKGIYVESIEFSGWEIRPIKFIGNTKIVMGSQISFRHCTMI